MRWRALVMLWELRRWRGAKVLGCVTAANVVLVAYHTLRAYHFHQRYCRRMQERLQHRARMAANAKRYPLHGEVEATEENFSQGLEILDVKNDEEFDRLRETTTWKLDREGVVFAVSGRATLLQMAHPYIAQGVYEHSNLQKYGMLRRFNRTFFYVFGMTFGGAGKMRNSALAVRGLHAKVKGEMRETLGPFPKGHLYSADNIPALLWVWATLFESSLYMHQMMHGELPLSEKREIYIVHKQSAIACFGFPSKAMPETYDDFMDYYARMWVSDVLSVGKCGKALKDYIFDRRSIPSYLYPVISLLESINGVMLPERAREQFGLRNSGLSRVVVFVFLGIARLVCRVLPAQLLYLSAYLKAEKRMRLAEGKPLRWEWPSRVWGSVMSWAVDRLLNPKYRQTPFEHTAGLGKV